MRSVPIEAAVRRPRAGRAPPLAASRAWPAAARDTAPTLFAAALDHLDDLALDASSFPELLGLSAEWATLKAALSPLDPTQIGPAEVARFALFALEAAEAFGPRQVAVAQEFGDVLGRSLVAAELREREVLVRFALRQLGRALHDFCRVVEGFRQLTQELSDEEHALVLGGMREELAGDLPMETARLFRAELCITLALDALPGPAPDLARWAQAAVMATHTLAASVVTEGWASLRAELARRVARQAHADWTLEDLDDEFGPWSATPLKAQRERQPAPIAGEAPRTAPEARRRGSEVSITAPEASSTAVESRSALTKPRSALTRPRSALTRPRSALTKPRSPPRALPHRCRTCPSRRPSLPERRSGNNQR